ncbi:uncharacterized protein LOC112598737 [Melanaphis sacchari]|uniref:uncharacterized protein LOC112598737 n=1 Tax=Melanaphis sacchari TaxID=742174 RepID=UPI000DC13E32|nr:uncharacterized protein LOC112598737 [Melanaphis sacchari]XP_025201105.1 uncharacterized protein LOC112598737 [Melanaphis sacchari]
MSNRRMLNKNKNYVNYYLLNGLLVMVYIMTLMSESHSSTLETESNTSCSDAITCTKCTIKAQCQWLLKQQECKKKILIHFSSLLVSTTEECPQFSVDRKYHYNDFVIKLKYTFRVSNDSLGFMNYLRTSKINLQRSLIRDKISYNEITYDGFIFSFYMTTFLFKLNIPSITEFIFIEFNDVMLRFDNVADRYVTFYKHDRCADDEDKYCASCAWNYQGCPNYLKWCSHENSCEGRKQLYLKNNTEEINLLKSFFYPQNNEAYVTSDCPKVNIIAVDPLSGPQTGGTAITITVRNHRILAENQTILVKVAGTECTSLKTLGPETITCTTSPWVNTTEGSLTLGPILVKYSSNQGELTIESSQIFQFDVPPICGTPSPVLDTNQRLRALESGDITVPVRGVHFVKPCVVSSARLFVLLPNGTMQFASNYCDIPVNDTFMVCRSPIVESRVWMDEDSPIEELVLNFGLNLMNFIGNQSIFVQGPSYGYHVLFDPVLVDFNIINSTGSVVFNGRYLNHLPSDVILIRILNSSEADCESISDCSIMAGCENVVFSQQKIICEPNTTIASAAIASRKILIMIGDSLSYTVSNRLPPPDLSNFTYLKQPSTLFGWCRAIIALSTSLLIVCALIYCLKTKNRYDLPETVCYPLVASTGL